jgi:transposase
MAHSTKSYSNDLRERVVKARLSGMSVAEVVECFSVDDNSVYRWVSQYKQTGSFLPKKRGGYKKPKIQDMQKFEAFAKAHAHSTLARMREQWDTEVSEMSLSRSLKRLGWTRKKNKPTTANAIPSNAKRSTKL